MATILVVDDVVINRRMLVAMLTKAGYRLLEAADGRAALASDALCQTIRRVLDSPQS